MADVVVAKDDWSKLRSKALFFVPGLLEVDAATHRKAIMEAAAAFAKSAQDKALELSPAAMTNLLSLRPMGHKKCESAVRSFNTVAEKAGLTDRLLDTQIIGAVFCSMQLDTKMDAAKLSAEDLARGPGAHFDDAAIIKEMIDGKRVTFAVGLRVARLLVAKGVAVNLREFLTVRYDRGQLSIAVDGDDRSLFKGTDLEAAKEACPGWEDWRDPLKLPEGTPPQAQPEVQPEPAA